MQVSIRIRVTGKNIAKPIHRIGASYKKEPERECVWTGVHINRDVCQHTFEGGFLGGGPEGFSLLGFSPLDFSVISIGFSVFGFEP